MPHKILAIDDDPQTLRLISLVLERQGFEVIPSTTGIESIALFNSSNPDLVLLDLMMPDMDGFEVARKIRLTPRGEKIPILIFSARGRAEIKNKDDVELVDDYLVKPILPEELASQITAWLRRSRQADLAAKPASKVLLAGISARGGVGLSTLLLNMAVAVRRQTRGSVIAAEMRPGQGAWAAELNLPDGGGVSRLLDMRLDFITPEAVANELYTTPSGVQLITSSNNLREPGLSSQAVQAEHIARLLAGMADYVALDFGPTLAPPLDGILPICTGILVAADARPVTLQKTRLLLESLKTFKPNAEPMARVVLIGQADSGQLVSKAEAEEILGHAVNFEIPYVPEDTALAGRSNQPLLIAKPESPAALKYEELAAALLAEKAA
jgi:pilus assembly protein CpaE